MSAALVALFAPYCDGANRPEQLEQALQLLAGGALEGYRRLRPEGGHRFQLTWTAAPSPLELSSCTLRFPATPEVHYRFDLPTHHLVQWLMDWLAQGGAQAGSDGHSADLPASFWQWLLLGTAPQQLRPRFGPTSTLRMGPASSAPSAKALLVGSCEAFSGKSAVVLGLARQLLQRGVVVRFGKPLATTAEPADGPLIDDDVRFVGQILGLAPEQLIPSVHLLQPEESRQRLLQGQLQAGAGFQALQQQLQAAGPGVTLLEAAGSISEGLLYGLSLPQLARELQAPVVLVHPWTDCSSADALLQARDQLGALLAGVVLNGVPPEALPQLRQDVVPALERLGLPVLGVMPRSPLLRSVTVEELARRLDARVLCCRERLDLLVETLSIGAMNVNSAMEFFRRRRNMAVVTGADRTDIQLAALEASTQCLILTGAGEPLPQLISRAEELDVPLLKVEHDTLTTVEVIERTFGHVRLHESVKATYAFRLVEEHCDFERLYSQLQLPVPA